MKNNIIKYFIIFLFIFNASKAEEFKFETSEIEIIDSGNLIFAKEGTAFSLDGNLEIEAKEFEYTKNSNLLKAYIGVALFKLDNLKIEFDEIIINQSDLTTQAKNNIKIIDLNKQFSIETNNLFFDKKKNILESKTPSVLTDKINNALTAENFTYNLNDGVLKLKNANLKDINDNNFNIETAFLNSLSEKLIGNDLTVYLNNESFDKDNDPRIKGRGIIYQDGITEITKGVFTTCKKTDKCPPWQLSAEKIIHNPKSQTINYKNAFLKVYDIPVMYFPKFFHPDPTVKRKSGFLIPTIKNATDSTSYFSVPYYSVISQNKDITLTPRFYSNNNLLLQTEYRQENEKSSHIADFSILNESNQDSKTHFFYRYNKLIDFANFEDGILNLNIEKTSNDTFLRKNKITSPIISNYNVLENTLSIDLYSADLSINSEIKVYENLDKENTHDKYEFILPKIDISKKLKNISFLDGSFLLNSKNFVRSYSTNILEKININNFIFNSSPKITDLGLYNSYDFILRNVNSDTNNSSGYKKDENFYLSGIFQFNSSFPMTKKNDEFLNILKPKIAFKISPNHTKDLSKNDGKRLDVNNIFNIDRLYAEDTVEGGASITLGNDFTIFDENKSIEIFSIKLANNLRLEENNDLPRNNQLNSKNSNFFGEIAFDLFDSLNMKYAVSTKNNVTDINYENFITELSINNFITSFDYINENHSVDKNSYLTNTTKYLFDNSNSIKFSTRDNKSSNLTEYYKLIYEYKNDCLAASIEYNKDYYADRDIKPKENIFFKLTIIPFGETSSPNLKN